MSDDSHQHFYITPNILPQPNDTDTEWIQRVTMLTEMSEELAKHIFTYLRTNTPILVEDDTLLYHLMAGLGLALRGITVTGIRQLEKVGKKPLDPQEEQSRLIRDELAKPNLDPQLRDVLLTVLAHNLEAGKSEPGAADSEWPTDGFVIGEDS